MADQLPASFVPDAPAAAMPASFVPDTPTFKTTNEPPSPSMWERANTPLIPQIAEAADAIADHLDKPRLDRSKLEAQIEGYFAGAAQGAGRVVGGFTSPVGLALTIAGLGPDSAIANRLPGLAKILTFPAVRTLQRTVQAGAGAAFAAEGASRVVTDPTIGGKGQGVAEMAAGAIGMVPGAAAAAHAAGPIVTSPLARKIASRVVKAGSTAAGAYVGGPTGAIVGSSIGEEIADAIRARPAPPAPPPNPNAAPPGVDRYLPSQSGYVPPVAAPPSTPAAAAPPTEFAVAQAARAATPAAAPAAGPIVPASGKMQLTAAEMKEFTRLVSKGMKLPDALEQVQAMRELAARFGSPSAQDVAQARAQRRLRYKS